MDPNETLKLLREKTAEVSESFKSESREDPSTFEEDALMTMADLFSSLDEWLTRGGFAPSDWPLVSMAGAVPDRVGLRGEPA